MFNGSPKRKAARSKRAGDARNHAESLDLSGFSAFFYFSGPFPFADLLIILISNKMLYLKSRVFHTLVPHVPCVTPSHKNLTRLAL